MAGKDEKIHCKRGGGTSRATETGEEGGVNIENQ